MSEWVKSKRSMNNGNCVEVIQLPNGTIGVRDDKQSKVIGDDAPVMHFTGEEWDSFTGQLKADRVKTAALAVGETVVYALSSGRTFAQVTNEAGNVDWVKSDSPDVIHTFSAGDFTPNNLGEVGAFALGAMGGEFDFAPIAEQQPEVA